MMAQKVSTVAILGTGIMGSGMARNLARAGLEMRAWNRTREKAEQLADAGITVADTPAEAVERADCVITMLTDGDTVRQVMSGGDGALAAISADAVWLQMSTIGIAATEELAGLAAERHLAFVDAPVLGTKQPAEAGQRTVLASGPDATLDRCDPVFEAVGARTIRLGKAGTGNRMKLVVNNWLVSLTVGLAETIALAERVEVDPARFLEIIKDSPMGVPYAELKGRMMIEREFEPAFPLRLAAKDARLALEAGELDGAELALTRAVERRFAEAIELGHGDEDVAAVYHASAAGR
jgi:3-hydroxyisobutyrate dehydrogenase